MKAVVLIIMGFFSKLFKKKEVVQPKSEAVELEKLKDWFLEQFKVDTSFPQETIHSTILDFNQIVIDLNTKRDILQAKDLMNKKIPDRAIHAMEGNRTNYVNQLNILINVLGKPEIDRDQLRDFLANYNEKISQFSESSARSFYVLNEFFSNEIKLIASTLANLDRLMKRLKDIVNKDKEMQSNQDEVLGLIKRITSFLKLRIEKRDEIKVLKQKLEESQLFKKRMETKLEDLKSSARYKNATSLIERKEALEKELAQTKDNIVQGFSPILKYLKKYERVALDDEALIKSYVSDAISSLESDEDLQIKTVLNKLKDGITSGSLETKDSEKVISKIDFLLTKIDMYRGDFLNVKEQFYQTRKLVLGDAALQQSEDLDYRIKHSDEQIIENDSRIKICEKAILEADPDTIKDKVKRKIKELLNINLTIIENKSE
jgi:hypothetical protein